jgi:hypothetical protein
VGGNKMTPEEKIDKIKKFIKKENAVHIIQEDDDFFRTFAGGWKSALLRVKMFIDELEKNDN